MARSMVKCTGAYLDYNNVSILATLCLWTSENSSDLLLLNPGFRLHVIYLNMHKDG
jgi:hypothetical protein